MSADLDMLFSLDYLEDDLSAYWGTPLVPTSFATDVLNGVINTEDGRVIDQRLRFINYNIEDQRSDSQQLWTKLVTSWQLSNNVRLKNTAFHFSADRAWKNAESYVFDPDTQLIDRDRFFVFHDHQFYGNQIDISVDGTLGKYRNLHSFGIDYAFTDFVRQRGFPDGDSVSPFLPESQLFGVLDKRKSPTEIKNLVIYFEDTLFLSKGWHISLCVRKDQIDLVRDNYDVDGSFIVEDSFQRRFNSTSYRLGSSYELANDVYLYGHLSTGHDPVGSNILLVNANENFELTDIRQYEVGVKSILAEDKIELRLHIMILNEKISCY